MDGRNEGGREREGESEGRTEEGKEEESMRKRAVDLTYRVGCYKN